MRQSVFRRRGPPRSLPVLAVVWASILVASPNALQRDVDDATAFKTHFLHFSDWSFLGPLDRDLRRECGCVSDALGLLPSFFPDPAGGEGPGSALRPSEAYPREHGRDYVRNLLSGERQGGTRFASCSPVAASLSTDGCLVGCSSGLLTCSQSIRT